MNAVAKEVRLHVNESALFRNMEHAFSANSVVTELIQNSRRAGATKVDITFDGSNLIVRDDGQGIDDLQDLLTAAGSGWDVNTVLVENPFGMGFLSTLYVCEEVSVSTRKKGEAFGQTFTAKVDALLEQKPARVSTDQDGIDEGTTIHLSGFDIPALSQATNAEGRVLTLQRRVSSMVAGFPIPVSFNSVALDRTDAVADDFEQTDVGLIRMNLDDVNGVATYLQGLVIRTSANRWFCSRNRGTILHLDESFIAKLPDRAGLVDDESGSRRIRQAINGHARTTLERLKGTMSAEDFVTRHAQHCLSWRCADLLNDIHVVPGSWFVDWKYANAGPQRSGHVWETQEGLLSKDSLEGQGVFALPDEGDGLARSWLMAGARQTFLMQQAIGEGHWLSAMLEEVTNSNIEVITTTELGRSWTSLNYSWDGVTLVVATDLWLRHTPSGLNHAIGVAYDEDEGCLYCTKGSSASAGTVLLSRYESENDRYMEEAEDEDKRTLNKAKAEMLAQSPAELLKIMLTQHDGLTDNRMLANATFSISFDENGKLKEVFAN